MSERLKNKVAIITGAGQGIGEATAIKFAKEGAKVTIAELNKETGNKVANLINEKFGSAQFIETDVSKSDSVKSMVDTSIKSFGSPDILVNNAGINVSNEPLEMSDNDWNKCFSVDLNGTWYGCKHVLPYMLEKDKGSIVNLASVHGTHVISKSFPYPVAKHGVIGLTKALAVGYAKKGIKINSISPGWVNTHFNIDHFNQSPDPVAAKKKAEMSSAINRLADPEEIANAALFMASDECNYMVGTNLVIDGGLTIRMWDNN